MRNATILVSIAPLVVAAVAACSSSIETLPATGSSSSSAGSGGSIGSGGAGGQGTGGAPSACTPGEHAPCYEGPPGTQNVGICKAGVKTCSPDGTAYGPCEGQVLPAADKCSTPEDEDCNGAPIPCVSDVAWNEHFGAATTSSVASAVAVDPAGNIVVLAIAQAADFGAAPLTGLVAAKLAPTGNVLWAKSFGGYESWGGVALDGAGNILLTGTHLNPVDFGGGPLVTTGGQEVFM